MPGNAVRTDRDKGTVRSVSSEEGYGVVESHGSGALLCFDLGELMASGRPYPVPGQVLEFDARPAAAGIGWARFYGGGRFPAASGAAGMDRP